MRQERLFGAHEIQRFNRDADETVAWISEKDGILSSEDYGRDLASVQTLQVSYIIILLLCYYKYYHIQPGSHYSMSCIVKYI